MLYNHPEQFTDGSRVLMRVCRNKDGVVSKQKTLCRISHNSDEFNLRCLELYNNLSYGERIYSTATPRCLKRASRLFREKQLESEYSEDPVSFYKALESRWASSLSDERSAVKSRKLWMFDCDCEEETKTATQQLEDLNISILYSYKTKNGGAHLFTKPFNRLSLNNTLIHTNPLMLWAYK